MGQMTLGWLTTCHRLAFSSIPCIYQHKNTVSMLENFTRKVVIVTGASSGIGEYAKRGDCLVLAATREDRLQEVGGRARALASPDIRVVPADVSKPEGCKRIVDEAADHFGRVDHLVNNAGIQSACALEGATDITNFRPVMDVISGVQFTSPDSPFHTSKTAMAKSLAWLLPLHKPPMLRMSIYNVQVSVVPVESAERCANAIVNSACHGHKYLTEPAWMKVTLYWKAFRPEIIEWCSRLLLFTKPGTSDREAPSKKILDLTGAKKFLYPPSIQSPALEVD